MINHIRTLLLNQPASRYSGITTADYIQPDFVTLSLPRTMLGVHRALFPTGINPYVELDIANIYLPLLHTPELYPYVTLFDPRITYTLNKYTSSDFGLMNISMIESKSISCDITPKYSTAAYPTSTTLNSAGEHVWTFRTKDAYTSYLDYSRGDTQIVTMVPLSNQRKVTNNIVLYPNKLTAYFAIPTKVLTGVYNFTYNLNLIADYDLPTRFTELSRLNANAVLLAEVFEPFKPYTTQIQMLQTAWTTAAECTLKYGAFLLAYLYQCERIRLQRTT